MMENMKLHDMIEKVENAEIIGDDNTEIVGLDYDSRRVKPGYLFAAIKGFKTDGSKFVGDAVKNGAAAVMSENRLDIDVPVVRVSSIRKALADTAAAFYDYPGYKLTNVGVTGTNGKSTCVALIKNILEHDGKKCGMVNSLTYDTGKKRYKAERTTPDSVDMQKYLAEMVESGCTHASLEVSSHALMLNRVDNIEFKYGLFTTFSRDHLDFHKDMDSYLKAKRILLERLDDPEKTAVVNADVPEFAGFAGTASSKFLTYGLDSRDANVTAEDIRFHAVYTDCLLKTPRGENEIRLALPGRYNLSNCLGAVAVGIAMGIEFETVCRAMEAASPVPGRFQPVDCGQPFGVIIDFAHTPDALARLCQSARELTEGRLLILFGCGGDRDRGKRPLMAGAASENSDFALLTSDNPRTESPQQIIDDAKKGMVGESFDIELDRVIAIEKIMKMAQPGDTVILAGKGAEEYQEIGTERIPYSDRGEAVKVLKRLGYDGERSV